MFDTNEQSTLGKKASTGVAIAAASSGKHCVTKAYNLLRLLVSKSQIEIYLHVVCTLPPAPRPSSSDRTQTAENRKASAHRLLPALANVKEIYREQNHFHYCCLLTHSLPEQQRLLCVQFYFYVSTRLLQRILCC